MAQNIKQLLSQKLVALSEGITPADMAEAEKGIPVSRPTLDKYLSGDIAKIETAMKIINFLTPIVQKRFQAIKETNLI